MFTSWEIDFGCHTSYFAKSILARVARLAGLKMKTDQRFNIIIHEADFIIQ